MKYVSPTCRQTIQIQLKNIKLGKNWEGKKNQTKNSWVKFYLIEKKKGEPLPQYFWGTRTKIYNQ